MNTHVKQDSFYSFLVFLISPLLSVFVALQGYKSGWGKNLIWMFVVFYAVSFSIPSENSDAYFYVKQLEFFHLKNLPLKDFTQNFYTTKPVAGFEKSFDDAVQPTITYTVSQFTDNYRVLYLVVGIIYGFFFSRNVWFLIENIRGRVKLIHILIIASFTFVIAFWQLNSIRMWTAAHMFFYGSMVFIQYRKKKTGLFFILMSTFMHFSFMLPVVSFCLYMVFGNRTKIYFYFFIATFFINTIDLGVVKIFLESVLPDFFHRRVETYTHEQGDAVAEVVEKSWHAVYYREILKWIIFFCIIVLYYTARARIEKNKLLADIFAFTLLFVSIAQISSLVPSGGRFLKLGYMFGLTSLFYCIQYIKDIKMLNNSSTIMVPGLIFFCIVSVRMGMDYINLGLFGNIFTLFIFEQIDVPIIDLFK